MWRERTLKVVLVLVGLLFLLGIYPTTATLWNHDRSGDTDAMMLSLYFVLGVFLLMAVKNPAAHRSLIAFAAWSSFAHGVVMGVLAVQIPAERTSLFFGTAILAIIGVALIALAPAKPSDERVRLPGAASLVTPRS
jgi:hypothetical protein